MMKIKSSYSHDEVISSEQNLRLLRSACPLKLTRENQETFITYMIGEEDKLSLYPSLLKMNDLVNKIQSIPFNFNGLIFDETDRINKEKLSKLHAELNLAMNEILTKTKQLDFLDKINGIANPKDAYSLLLPIPNGINSEIFSISFKHIAVHPPLNTTAYKTLSIALSQNTFITYNLGLKNESSYGKYIAGQTQPNEINWGILLLSLGIHPVYEIKHKDTAATLKQLKKLNISINNEESFTSEYINRLKRMDLKEIPKSIKLLSKDKSFSLPQIKEKLYSKIQKNCNSTRYAMITNKLELLHNEYSDHPSTLVKIRKYLNHLATTKIIDNKDVISALSYYSTPLDEVESSINIESQFGEFSNCIQLTYLPSPTIFTILQKKLNLDFLKQNHFNTKYLYWYNLEKGGLQATSIYYAFILLSLNLHPIYTLSLRKNNKKSRDIFNLFKDFHKVTIQDDSAVYAKKEENFTSFIERYFSLI